MDALTPADWALVVELMTRARAKMGISMAGAAATYLPDSKLLVAINLIQMEASNGRDLINTDNPVGGV